MKISWMVLVLFVLRGCAFTSPSFAQAEKEPEVIVELSRDKIYEGESVRYRVTLNHVEQPGAPRLEGFDDFDVEAAGETNLNSRQVFNFNGRVTEIVRYGRAYDYILTPQRAGRLEIPAPTAEIDGKLLTGRKLALHVIAPQDQEVAFLEITTDRDIVYPMQPFTVTLRVAVKALEGRLADRNPVMLLRSLSHRVQLPALVIPWADDDKLATGLEPKSPWQKWLGKFQSRNGAGFSVNNVGKNSLSLLFDDGPMAFLSQPRRIKRKDKSDVEADYWQFEFARSFTPQALGELSFGPVTLRGTFITDVNERGEVDTDQIYAVARPVGVTVKDVPADGRPDSYIDAVGKFDVVATLVPAQAKVGDPMTLTIMLRGQGTFDRATAPDLKQIPEIVERFRVYEATEETRSGQRQFTYSMRPLKGGEIAFPAVPLSYFDVDQERFVTLQTDPISIVVGEAEKLSGNEIATADAGTMKQRSLQLLQDGLLANFDDPSVLRNQSVQPLHWLTLFTGMAGTYLVVVLASDRIRLFFENEDLRRRRVAPSKARRRLREALAGTEEATARDSADTLGAAIVGLVADVAGIDEAGLTSTQAGRQVEYMAINQQIAARLSKFLESCDDARYGASVSELHGLSDEAISLLDDLIKALKCKKLL